MVFGRDPVCSGPAVFGDGDEPEVCDAAVGFVMVDVVYLEGMIEGEAEDAVGDCPDCAMFEDAACHTPDLYGGDEVAVFGAAEGYGFSGAAVDDGALRRCLRSSRRLRIFARRCSRRCGCRGWRACARRRPDLFLPGSFLPEFVRGLWSCGISRVAAGVLAAEFLGAVTDEVGAADVLVDVEEVFEVPRGREHAGSVEDCCFEVFTDLAECAASPPRMAMTGKAISSRMVIVSASIWLRSAARFLMPGDISSC